MDIKSLLESAIESLSNNCSIETIMLKAQTIAYILKDDDFKKWINCEQNGYTDDDLLPTYRIIGCQVHLDISRPFIGIIQNFSFPPGLMGKYDKRLFSMPFHNPLVEIERYSLGTGQITSEIIAGMYPEINKYIEGHIINAKQCVSPTSLTSIISTFKSKLLDFFLKLNDELETNIDLTKLGKNKTVETIMNQTIFAGIVNTGSGDISVKNSNVINGNDNNILVERELKEKIENLLEQIKFIEITNKEDKQDVNQSISDIKNEINTNKPDAGIIRRSLKVLKTIPTIMVNQGIAFCIDQLLEKLSTYV